MGNYRRHSDTDEKAILHHNHYRSGSLESSYTAINGPTGTPFRHCKDKKHKHKHKRTIEIIVKPQGVPVYTDRPPPTQRWEESYEHDETVYKPPPRAKKYEVYQPSEEQIRTRHHHRKEIIEGRTRRTSQDDPSPPHHQKKEIIETRTRRTSQEQDDPPPPPPPRKEKEVLKQFTRTVEQKSPAKKEGGTLVTETTNKYRVNMRNVEDKKGKKATTVTEGTGVSMRNIEDKKGKKANTVTQGTGQSMINVPPPPVPFRQQQMGGYYETEESRRRTVQQHGVRFKNRPRYSEDPASVYTYQSEPESFITERSSSKVKDYDLCPLCHKGWYVRKFTWSGIVAAIFCFPCGILFCFKMRVYVCSFCGEEPVGKYKGYKESDAKKVEGDEFSRSKVIPPSLVTPSPSDKKNSN